MIDVSVVRVLAFLNIVSSGMREKDKEQNVARMDPELCAAMIKEHRDVIVGIKAPAQYFTTPKLQNVDPPAYADPDHLRRWKERYGVAQEK